MNIASESAFDVIKRSLRILPKSDKTKLFIVIFFQALLGIVDLLAIILVGLLGALTVSGIESQKPEGRISDVIELLNLNNYGFQTQVAIIGLSAGVLLITRTVMSIIISRKVLFFLSRRGAAISRVLITRLLSQSILFIQEKTIQERVYSVSNGVQTIALGIVGALVSILSDLVILSIMAIGLFVVNPIVASGTAIFFILIALILNKFMSEKSRNLGAAEAQLQIKSISRLYEIFSVYRQAVVAGRRRFYIDEITDIRHELAEKQAQISFMPSISKYVIEAMLVIGALLISATQFIFSDAKQAIATLAIFLAAGTRIAPAVLRVQQGTMGIKSAIGSANPTLDLIEDLDNTSAAIEFSPSSELLQEKYTSVISASNISYTYPEGERKALDQLTLEVSAGETLAIVGPSGAGKTTLVDMLLGVLEPDSGSVLVFGKKPLDAFNLWPGSTAYVTQDSYVVNGTIRSNVGLGFALESATDEIVKMCLESAQMLDTVMKMSDGLDAQVGENGNKLSGGQRQRLGIARAFFTNPKLIVLDEASSALDSETEEALNRTLLSLKGKVTIVIIAHRLSSVRAADKVAYIPNGKMLALGTFAEVRSAIPNFDKSAKLLGL